MVEVGLTLTFGMDVVLVLVRSALDFFLCFHYPLFYLATVN